MERWCCGAELGHGGGGIHELGLETNELVVLCDLRDDFAHELELVLDLLPDRQRLDAELGSMLPLWADELGIS